MVAGPGSHTLYLTSAGSSSLSTQNGWTVAVGSNAFLEKVSGVVLVHADVPNVFPNVRENEITLTLSVDAGGGNTRTNTLTVPAGFYSATSLAATMTTLNNSANTGVTTVTTGTPPTEPIDWSVGFTGSRFTVVQGSTVYTCVLSFSSNGRSSYTTPQRLGFTTETITTTASTTITATELPNLYGEQIIHVACDTKACSNYTHAGDASLYDILGTVSLTSTPYGSYATYTASDKALSDIHFRGQSVNLGSRHEMVLLDEECRQLKIPAHHPVRLVIRCYHGEFDPLN